MLIGKSNIKALFFYYNETYFGGVLPIPEVKVTHSYNVLGQFVCYITNDNEHYDEVLSVSDTYDYTEDQLRDIIVHEMIHYYLVHVKMDLKCSHGKAFKDMADDFNIRYGMNITSTADLDQYKLIEGRSKILKSIYSWF